MTNHGPYCQLMTILAYDDKPLLQDKALDTHLKTLFVKTSSKI